MEDLKASRVSAGIHALVAIGAGFASIFLNSGWFALILAIAILVILGRGIEKLVGARGRKWWIGNGAFIYFLIWIVSWVFFFNILTI